MGGRFVSTAPPRGLVRLHKVHNRGPALARMLTAIPVKDRLAAPAGQLDLDQARTADGLLQKVEAVLRMLEDKRLLRAAAAACAVVLGGIVLALKQAVVDITKHDLSGAVQWGVKLWSEADGVTRKATYQAV